ncbi:hypothetical protein BJ742DRAFT_894078 [Cladochytrium replicatum]|nr:hypothetical protein BJ742DRAFT_894078 [Cladochytrium replicatum]
MNRFLVGSFLDCFVNLFYLQSRLLHSFVLRATKSDSIVFDKINDRTTLVRSNSGGTEHCRVQHRKYQGFFGAVYGIASVVGHLAGGAFTDSSATWRMATEGEKSMKEKLSSIDYIGVSVLGNSDHFSDAPNSTRRDKPGMERSTDNHIIFGVTIPLLYPGRLCFQVVNGDSATASGLKSIPMMGGVVVFTVLTGLIISRTWHIVLIIFIGGALLAVLLSTINEKTEYRKSALMLFTRLLAEAAVHISMIAIATSLSGFCETFGGGIGISIFGAVFSNTFYSELINNFQLLMNPESAEILSISPNDVHVILMSLANYRSIHYSRSTSVSSRSLPRTRFTWRYLCIMVFVWIVYQGFRWTAKSVEKESRSGWRKELSDVVVED